MDIALAATPALGDQKALAILGQITNLLVGFHTRYHGADRHADDRVIAGLAGHLATHAVFATQGTKTAHVAKIDERIQAFIGDQPDTATIGTIAAIRAAKRNEFFAPEADATIAAVTGKNLDGGFVDELHKSSGFGIREWGFVKAYSKNMAFVGAPSGASSSSKDAERLAPEGAPAKTNKFWLIQCK